MKEKKVSLWIALIFLAGVFYLFAVKGMKFYLVPSKSMVPTLEQSDYIAGFKINRSEIKRGEIIVFTSGHKEDFYVKRIIGLPGETLAIADGFVYINGRKLDEPYVKSRGADNFGPITIPDGYVFVMGDNRTDSFDSRQFGPIPERLLETKVAFIYNPISRIGCVH